MPEKDVVISIKTKLTTNDKLDKFLSEADKVTPKINSLKTAIQDIAQIQVGGGIKTLNKLFKNLKDASGAIKTLGATSTTSAKAQVALAKSANQLATQEVKLQIQVQKTSIAYGKQVAAEAKLAAANVKLLDGSTKLVLAKEAEANAQRKLIEANNITLTQAQKQILANNKVAESTLKLKMKEEDLLLSKQKVALAKQRTANASVAEIAARERLRASIDRNSNSRNKEDERIKKSLSSMEKLRKGISNVNIARAGLRNLAFFFGAREIITQADAFLNLTNRIKILTTTAGGFQEIQKNLLAIAKESRTPIGELATVYQRFDRAFKLLGKSQKASLRFTKTITKATKLSGASTAESVATIRQLSQALNKGKLDGEEFRSVMEQMPIIADAIAKQMGVATDKLQELAPKGKITADVISKAVLGMSVDVDKAFENMTLSIADSFVLLQNSASELIGNSGIGLVFAKSVKILADNLKSMVIVGTVAAVYFGGPYVASMVAASFATGALGASMSFLAKNPLILLIAGLGLFAAKVISSTKSVKRLNLVVDKSGKVMESKVKRVSGLSRGFDRLSNSVSFLVKGWADLASRQIESREINTQALVLSAKTGRSIKEEIKNIKALSAANKLRENKRRSGLLTQDESKTLKSINKGLDDYIKRVNMLNSILKKGKITQEEINDDLRDSPFKDASKAVDDFIKSMNNTGGLAGKIDEINKSFVDIKETVRFAQKGAIALFLANTKLTGQAKENALGQIYESQGRLLERITEELRKQLGIATSASIKDSADEELESRIKILKILKQSNNERVSFINGMNLISAKSKQDKVSISDKFNSGDISDKSRRIELKSVDTSAVDAQIELLGIRVDASLSSRLEKEKMALSVRLEFLDSSNAAELSKFIDLEKAKEQIKIDSLKRRTDMIAASATKGVSMAQGAATALETINNNRSKKDVGRARKLFKLQKSLAIVQAGISTAKAVVGALADTPGPYPVRVGAAISAGVLGAIQIAAIASQKFQAFQNGGSINGAGTGRSDRVNIMASKGEFIVNAEQAAKNSGLLNSINDGNIVNTSSSGSSSASSISSSGIAPDSGSTGGNVSVNIYTVDGVTAEVTESEDDENKRIDIMIRKVDEKLAQNASQGTGSLTEQIKLIANRGF